MKITSCFALVISSLVLVLGSLSLATNSLEAYPTPAFYMLFLALTGLAVSIYVCPENEIKPSIIILAGLALISAIILKLLPVYIQGFNINGLIHRSIISALLLIGIGVPSSCYALYYFLGATPRAGDISRYPLLAFPVVLILAAFAIVVFKIIIAGAPQLNWSLLVTAYKNQSWYVEVWQNGWPNFVSKTTLQIGLRNAILGTFLLMGLTADNIFADRNGCWDICAPICWSETRNCDPFFNDCPSRYFRDNSGDYCAKPDSYRQ